MFTKRAILGLLAITALRSAVRHLQLTLIGATCIAALVGIAVGVCWISMQIPNHPFVLGTIVAALLAWGIGMFLTDNMK